MVKNISLSNEENKVSNYSKEEAGELGLANIITLVNNSGWKFTKMCFLREIREDPTKISDKYKVLDIESRIYLDQCINIELIAEAVSLSELIGAYFLAFSRKKANIQKVLCKYKTKEIKDLYERIKDMDYNQISKLICYPSIDEFEPNSKKKIKHDLQKSSKNIKKTIFKISSFYLNNLEFYNDFKHGFRIFPTTSSPPDSKTFGAIFRIHKGDIFNKILMCSQDLLKLKADEAFTIANKITKLLEILLPIYRERIIENKENVKISLFNDIEEGVNNFPQEETKNKNKK